MRSQALKPGAPPPTRPPVPFHSLKHPEFQTAKFGIYLQYSWARDIHDLLYRSSVWICLARGSPYRTGTQHPVRGPAEGGTFYSQWPTNQIPWWLACEIIRSTMGGASGTQLNQLYSVAQKHFSPHSLLSPRLRRICICQDMFLLQIQGSGQRERTSSNVNQPRNKDQGNFKTAENIRIAIYGVEEDRWEIHLHVTLSEGWY
ncbi:hypothetical protein AGOR_G00226530 [Albula goreensis]|uniref:Uncharacterized protein n=1 Tax=Albula goreensis TaxID=1534307 RepID=A0A8T3CKH7_9TELE|nr:hypothetical protein AGOR_G00226530 [Albula goreensis]